MKPKIHSRYDPPRHPGLSFDDESKTRQEFKEEADINNFIKRYQSTGFPWPQPAKPPAYLDVTDVPDNYQDALAVIQKAQAAFGDLPSDVRERMKNDPANMVAYLNNPKNRAEAEELGLLEKKAPPPAPPAPPAPPSAPPATAGAVPTN